MNDFRYFLQNELIKRCKANPRYSLRAFARSLDLESSRLSKILKGQRPIRKAMLEKLAMRMGLTLEQIQKFSSEATSSSEYQQREYQQLNLDTFLMISDWKHYAILELMKVKGFKPNAKWISKCLGVSVNEISICIERLERVKILHIQKSGKWVDKSKGFSTHVLGENFSSHAHRLVQEEILKLAIHALQNLPLDKRDQSSMMMATNRDRLQEAKLKIKKFRRELCEYLEEAPVKDAVFQLSVSLFPLTGEME